MHASLLSIGSTKLDSTGLEVGLLLQNAAGVSDRLANSHGNLRSRRPASPHGQRGSSHRGLLEQPDPITMIIPPACRQRTIEAAARHGAATVDVAALRVDVGPIRAAHAQYTYRYCNVINELPT